MAIRANLGFALSFALCMSACAKTQESNNINDSIPIVIASTDVKKSEIANLETAIDKTVLETMRTEHIPGAAVIVVKDGQIIFKRGYGLANVETGRKVDPDKTLFRIGSVSKALTSLAITRLADQNQINLEDNVADYFKGFADVPNPGGTNEIVKIRHLITHTSGLDQVGIGRHEQSWAKPLKERKALRPSITKFLSTNNLRRISPPGLHYRYDTYGPTLAGAIMENVTQKPYAEAMKTVFFEPLGMTRSFVETEPEYMDDLALGYGYNNGEYVAQPYEIYVTTPASSIDATPADMGLILEALTNNGKSSKGRLFSPGMTQEVLAPQFRPHPDFPGVTHGLMEQLVADKLGKHQIRSIGHGGSMLGYLTSFTVFPELNTGLFVVVNRDWEAGGGGITIHSKINQVVLDTLHTSSEQKPFNVPPLNNNIDLNEYAGNYYYGVFCHSCTAKELSRGGWPRGQANTVAVTDGGLEIRGKIYLPSAIDGIFVSTDGSRKVFFGRGKIGEISFFSYDSSPDTFERIAE